GAYAALTGFKAGSLAVDLLGPLVLTLSLQGIAIMHTLNRGRRFGGMTLGMLYAAMLVIPTLAWPMLIAIALLDGLIDIRARVGSTRGDG
ncbi:MAG: hypothetical protein KDK91_30680, partial [Gammaproteobacteria bacterium]|nr:hypothetical protein [Gammaproteobacteria bacterium]